MRTQRTDTQGAGRPATDSDDLAEVVEAVRTCLDSCGESDRERADAVAAAVGTCLPDPDNILTGAQLEGDPEGYQQHVLHVEPDGHFSVVALVWRPGQDTPVHDHVSWCVVAVLRGVEREERFAFAEEDPGALTVRETVQNQTGSVTGVAPPGDIHRVSNGGETTAVSLHIYGADIDELGSSIRRVYDNRIV